MRSWGRQQEQAAHRERMGINLEQELLTWTFPDFQELLIAGIEAECITDWITTRIYFLSVDFILSLRVSKSKQTVLTERIKTLRSA